MKQAVVVSLMIGADYVSISASECINGTFVRLYRTHQRLANLEAGREFIAQSLTTLGNKLPGAFSSINVILDDFSLKQLRVNYQLVAKMLVDSRPSTAPVLQPSNYWTAYQTIHAELHQDQTTRGQQLVALVPITFSYAAGTRKTPEHSKTFPSGLAVRQVGCDFSAVSVDRDFYNRILAVFAKTKIQIGHVLVASQLGFYKPELHLKAPLCFNLEFATKKTVLLTVQNQVVINQQELRFTYSDLVEQLTQSYDISAEVAHNLIQNYGLIFATSETDLTEVIYLNHENSLVTRQGLQKVIKSFLKTICLQAKPLIQAALSSPDYDYEVVITGQLQILPHLSSYCQKYLKATRVVTSPATKLWNPNYETEQALWHWLALLRTKIPAAARLALSDHTTATAPRRTSSFKLAKKRPGAAAALA